MTEKINKGCEFQSDCIEYKDISYLKVMPICAIYELSIACHHKVDRCKYYKLYKQLKRLEQENKELKEKIIKLSEEKGHLIVENNTLKESNQSLSMLGTDLASANETVRKEFFRADKNKDMWREKAEEYRSALEEIKTVINQPCDNCKYNKDGITCSIGDCGEGKLKIIENKINEVLND